MKRNWIPQKWRFAFLLIEAGILLVANRIGFGAWLPSTDPAGWWFYSAFLGLLFGKRLDTPFFAKPVDVLLYALPSLIALLQSGATLFRGWGDIEKSLFVALVSFSGFVASMAGAAVWGKPEKGQKSKTWATTAKLTSESLGAPNVFFSVLFFLVLIAFNRSSPHQLLATFIAWACTVAFSPLDGAYRWLSQIAASFSGKRIFSEIGEIAAYQTPGIVLIRQTAADTIVFGDILAISDPLGKPRITLALDHVGRDEGLLLRVVDVSDAIVSVDVGKTLSRLSPNSAIRLDEPDESIVGTRLVTTKTTLVGLVAPETTVERLLFEVVKNEDLEEGRLVEVQIGSRAVTYQLIDGLTKEDVVLHKNTHGYVRAQAQKIGEWDAVGKRFILVKWMPSPNAPVFLRTSAGFQPISGAIGHFPGTDCPVSVKSVHDLVTHNTAILGILGIGKSMLAMELVERMMSAGIKVICVDLTNEYSSKLAAYIDTAKEASVLAELQAIGAGGKFNVHQNVEEGGSITDFAAAVSAKIAEFMRPADENRLMVFNPTHYEVWRQDSKPFSGKASMASLSPAQITYIISQATLEATSALGITDKARVCLVYEEAHALVPEWNSAVADGDKAASNGSARAILQGRKYGLGCLLVAQRTANVTKTILNQCNTIFAMRTFDDTGKDFLANYIGADYSRSLSSLSERQAVFFGKASSCENPILIRLNDRDKFLEVFRAENPPPAIRVGDAAFATTTARAAVVEPTVNTPDDEIPF